MRIGEVAEAAGVTVETLRFYERRGVLAAPRRLVSGYREYPPEAIQVVGFIKQAQSLGFTLDDVTGLLRLSDGGPDNCDAVRHLTHSKIDDMDEKIAKLTAMRTALIRLADTCERPRVDRDCPLLAALPPHTTAGPFTAQSPRPG
ncbi:MerR family transcriptional regulator [Streptomyces sp. H27-D2]|uniref:MerR family transcriptional regulator n=1 Tax=Streptomyces sp. H27-D2 TaxID=3046304 RepID=UPI002DBE1411|nr:MerR family transcriptional regulator [Streptomyces sp. H27-D2]MEC4017101.1 MerR family transcriptional regulator [Streptomyces sp. H27-D2]